jgi:endonuclease YncB( thermonuclease family)
MYHRAKLKQWANPALARLPDCPHNPYLSETKPLNLKSQFHFAGRSTRMINKFLFAALILLIPASADAADVSGVPKIRDGDQITIGNTRIRLGGIDAPSLDQLCLNATGERWTCGVAARDELIRHVDNKSWTCHVQRTDTRGRSVARCDVDGEDIQKWMVKSGWALAYVRFSHDYDAEEKAAREAKSGLWEGAFIAPWDWRVRNKKTMIQGSIKLPDNASAILLASASGPVAPSPTCTIKGNVNGAGECIYHTPASRWYAQIKMHVSKGTRWFCSVDDAEAAGCRETKR